MTDITNSPGTQLKYRLPINISHGWQLFAATAVCLVWNGVGGFVRRHRPALTLGAASPIGGSICSLSRFCRGAFLIYYFVRALLIATGVGPTQIEISDHPLWPGKSYRVYVSQTGHLSMKSFRVTLECEEIADYRQGTDTRTDRCAGVSPVRCFTPTILKFFPALPYVAQCQLQVPAAADALVQIRP